MQKQTIAILGANTPEGILVATGLAKSTHKILLWANNDLADTQWMAIDMQKHFPGADIEAVCCNVDASWEADIIIAAVPFPELGPICESIKEVSTRKILVHISEAAHEAASVLCNKLLPHTKLVNVITEWSGKKSVVFVQSNNDEALERVAALLQEAGITPITAACNEQLERA
jgi:predicted dinucleotide-binding enzyme